MTSNATYLWILPQLDVLRLDEGISLVMDESADARYLLSDARHVNHRCVITFSGEHPHIPPAIGCLSRGKPFQPDNYQVLCPPECSWDDWKPQYSLSDIVRFALVALSVHVDRAESNILFDKLHDGIFVHLFEYLTLKDLGRFGLVNTHCRDIFNLETVWWSRFLVHPPVPDTIVSLGGRIGLTRVMVEGTVAVGSKAAYRNALACNKSFERAPILQRSVDQHLSAIRLHYENVKEIVNGLRGLYERQFTSSAGVEVIDNPLARNDGMATRTTSLDAQIASLTMEANFNGIDTNEFHHDRILPRHQHFDMTRNRDRRRERVIENRSRRIEERAQREEQAGRHELQPLAGDTVIEAQPINHEIDWIEMPIPVPMGPNSIQTVSVFDRVTGIRDRRMQRERVIEDRRRRIEERAQREEHAGRHEPQTLAGDTVIEAQPINHEIDWIEMPIPVPMGPNSIRTVSVFDRATDNDMPEEVYFDRRIRRRIEERMLDDEQAVRHETQLVSMENAIEAQPINHGFDTIRFPAPTRPNAASFPMLRDNVVSIVTHGFYLAKFEDFIRNKLRMWEKIARENCNAVGKLVLSNKIRCIVKETFASLVGQKATTVDILHEEDIWKHGTTSYSTLNAIRMEQLANHIQEIPIDQITTHVAPFKSRVRDLDQVEFWNYFATPSQKELDIQQLLAGGKRSQGIYRKVSVRALGFALVTYVVEESLELRSIVEDYASICQRLKPNSYLNSDWKALVIHDVGSECEESYMAQFPEMFPCLLLNSETCIVKYLTALHVLGTTMEGNASPLKWSQSDLSALHISQSSRATDATNIESRRNESPEEELKFTEVLAGHLELGPNLTAGQLFEIDVIDILF